MPTNRRIFSQDAAVAAGDADSAQGLVLHLDANDEDSIESGGANQGNGSGTWFDIANHDLNVPRIDPASDLKLELNFSDTSSYSGSGAAVEDVSPEGTDFDGTINGNVTYGSDTVGYITFDDNPRSSFVTIGSTGDFDLDDGDATIELWVYRTSTSEQDIISTTVDGSSNGYAIFWSSSGYHIIERATAARVQTGTSGAATGVWEHVVFTWDESALSFNAYLNGTKSNTNQVNGSGTIGAVSRSLDLHNHGAAAGIGKFTGRFNSVRWYTRILTDSEIAQNYRAGCFFSYDSPYTTDVLVDYRPSNYVSGTTLPDVSGNSNTANLLGGIESTYDKELGDSFDLAGGSSGDRIESGTSVSFNTQTDGMTVEIWFKPDADSQSYIWSADQVNPSGTTEFNISIRSGREIQWFYQDTSGQHILSTGSSAYALNEWHCLICTTDGSTAEMYLDGVLEDSHSTQAESRSFSGDLYFGDYFGGSNGYYGMLGTCRFWKKGLTAAQAYQNYLATKNDYPNGNNAAITGALFGGTSPSYFTFDGASDIMEITHSNDVQIDGAYTWMFWFRPHNTNSGNYLMSKIQASNFGQNIILQSNNVIRFTGYSGGNLGSRHETVNNAFTDNAWQHLAITIEGNKSGDDIDFYINGSQVSHSTGIYSSTTLVHDQNPDSSNSSLFIGAYKFGSNLNHFFDGDIGYFKCLKKQLSSSEILAEFNATKATFGL